jgi:hypothetical protein
MRLTSLTAAALMGAALLVPMGTATAAGETCQGQPATMLGTPGGQITGTEGKNVIVTNGATTVNALGGNDLICVTGAGATVTVDAGAGDDSVLVEAGAAPQGTVTTLGAGADNFDARNEVQLGFGHNVTAGAGAGTDDTEADIIRSVSRYTSVGTGTAGQPNPDVIDVAGAIVYYSGLQTPTGSVRATSGELRVTANGDTTLDAGSGTMTSADASLSSFAGFGGYVFTTQAERGTFTFRGTDRDEHVKVDAPRTYQRDVELGRGDDRYESDSLGGNGSLVDGGAGVDKIVLHLPAHRVTADLGRSRVTATAAGIVQTTRASKFDDLYLSAKRADVIGTNRANAVALVACRAHVKAKNSRDSVTVSDEGGYDLDPRCSSYGAVVFGGRGHDTILGSWGNDRLIGGPGRDKVRGRGGRDVCQGEQVSQCEKRIR